MRLVLAIILAAINKTFQRLLTWLKHRSRSRSWSALGIYGPGVQFVNDSGMEWTDYHDVHTVGAAVMNSVWPVVGPVMNTISNYRTDLPFIYVIYHMLPLACKSRWVSEHSAWQFNDWFLILCSWSSRCVIKYAHSPMLTFKIHQVCAC